MIQMSRKVFGAVTVALVIIIVFCVRGTVMSREDNRRAERNHTYAALEQEYLERTHRLLEEEGFKNCGVNLRWIDDWEGNREYTVLLHHRRLERMSGEEQAALTDRLSAAEFRNTGCRFSYIIG